MNNKIGLSRYNGPLTAFMKRSGNFLSNPFIMFTLIVTITLIISLQNYFVKPAPNGLPDQELTLYSNFLIFKNSFIHLVNHQDLYIHYQSERVDLFKYSPAFALFMAPFSILPEFAGLFLWNFLNFYFLYLAIWLLPIKTESKKLMAFVFVVFEALTAMTNSQSNSLVAAFIILGFIFIEKNKIALATLFIVSTVFIKLFGLVALALFLFYSKKLKIAAFILLWTIALTAIPLLVTTPTELLSIYKSWWLLLSNDYTGTGGLSVIAWLNTWFGMHDHKKITVLTGLVIFCIPLLRINQFKFAQFRLLFLASVLMWVVLFNHKAESPTFVIAVSGIAIWFFVQKTNAINFTLLLFALFFTLLAPTDLFPAYVRNNIFEPYTVKVLPCLLIWLKLIYDLMVSDFALNQEQSQVKGIFSKPLYQA